MSGRVVSVDSAMARLYIIDEDGICDPYLP